MLLLGNADREQQLAGGGLGRVAVELRELVLELGGMQAFRLAHRRLRVEAVALLVDLPQPLVTHDHRVDHGEFLERELVLAQLADARVRVDETLPCVGSSSPPSTFMKVVLPEPFAPISP